MEDEQIIALYWDRSEDAIRETNFKYGPYCENISYGILRNREDSKECVSDTWLRAWNTMPPQKPTYLSLFLAKIVRNLSLDRYRKGHAVFRGSGQTALVYEELEEAIPSLQSGEQLADTLEIRDSLERFLDGLPLQQRQIFLLRYWYVHTPKEIGQQLGIRQQKINNMLYELRKKLKKHLEQEGIWL